MVVVHRSRFDSSGGALRAIVGDARAFMRWRGCPLRAVIGQGLLLPLEYFSAGPTSSGPAGTRVEYRALQNKTIAAQGAGRTGGRTRPARSWCANLL
jgi:hypothetical protein